MKKPLVSVIMPTYNRARYLADSISSVLKQTYANFELLIIDDGSTDKTKNVVKYFTNKDPRVRYFVNEHSGRPAIPRNFGLKQARGEYLTFLDSDDEYLPEKIVRQMEFLQDEGLDVVGVGGIIVDITGQKIKEVIPEKTKDWLEKILGGNFVFNPIMIRRAAYEKIGGFDERAEFIEDWEWLIRICEHLKFGLLSESLFKYRIHGRNWTSALEAKNKATSLAYILGKHQVLYAFYPVAHVRALLDLYSYYMLSGEVLKAREQLLLALSLRPLNVSLWARWILTYVGGPKFYRFLVGELKRLKGEFF